jgi:hypothetical protein
MFQVPVMTTFLDDNCNETNWKTIKKENEKKVSPPFQRRKRPKNLLSKAVHFTAKIV